MVGWRWGTSGSVPTDEPSSFSSGIINFVFQWKHSSYRLSTAIYLVDFQGLEVCVSGESTALTRHLVYFLNASQRHHCWRHLLLNSSISSSFQVLSTQSFFQFDTNTIHNDFYLNYCTYKHLKTIKSTPTPFQTLESTIPNHTLYRPHNLHSKIHANLWATGLHLNTYAIKSESAKSSYDQHSPWTKIYFTGKDDHIETVYGKTSNDKQEKGCALHHDTCFQLTHSLDVL